ncbi:hypothetical protein [Deinococcus radiophilus]|uniref:Uncharacterized protein n=1 Tax=Deinococcus radiophilus TaxID=32062 RepID=A0A3S0K902_9DEIO|nr:hypothetical protein [Deinococcus radiophilus]RTR25341.1 hypothetical protein EJ104_11315 [Deinococcus radiophilus]UFA50487.1 hypothetical protein LMT64_00780 [Deinococcus radiophilus]
MLLPQAQAITESPRVLPEQQLLAPILSGNLLCIPGTDHEPLNGLGGCQENALLALSTVRQLAQAAGMTAAVADETLDGQVYRDALTISTGLHEGTRTIQLPSQLRRDGEVYYSAATVLKSLTEIVPDAYLTPLPRLGMQVSGLNVDFGLATASEAQRFLDDLSFPLVTTLLPEVFEGTAECPDEKTCEFVLPTVASPATAQLSRRVQTGLPAGEVVMLVMPEPKDGGGYYVATAPVQAGGWAELRVREQPQQFVTDTAAVLAKPENLGHALLVRMTNTPLNDLASGIIQPQLD